MVKSDNRNTDNIADIIIPLIVLFSLIIFIIFISYVLISSNFATTTPENPVSTDTRGTLTKLCDIGECATNIISGLKFCSGNNTQVLYNEAFEVCNPRNSCKNRLTPYAVRSDGSTDINGICNEGVVCACINKPQCPTYILSSFTTLNGSILKSFDNQRLIFPQESQYSPNSSIITSPPMQIQSPVSQFCNVPVSYLQYISPGCVFANINPDNTGVYNDVRDCMNMSNNCKDTIYENENYRATPCLNGTLSIITDNPDQLKIQDINNYILGCVSGPICKCDEISVYDTNFGVVQCMKLN